MRNPPHWSTQEILQLFQTLGCPYAIRNDAITAVGAPNSISYLVRAIYWLYQVAKSYFETDIIREESEIASNDEDPTDQLFR